jgi:hypothetical protein
MTTIDFLNTEEFLEIKTRIPTFKDDVDTLFEYFFDESNELPDRIKCLLQLQKKDNDLLLETVNKIVKNYDIYSSSSLTEMLDLIINENKFDIYARRICIETIYLKNKEKGAEYFKTFVEDEKFKSLSFHIRFETLKILGRKVTTKDYSTTVISGFTNLFVNDSYEIEFRFKMLKSLYDLSEKFLEFKEISLCIYNILLNEKIPIYLKIISISILYNNTDENNKKEKLLELLSSFASDNNLDYNLRANSADTMLLLIGNNTVFNSFKYLANDIITTLGIQSGSKTIYNNAQNVHNKSVEQSVKKILLEISSMKIEVINGKEVDFNFCLNDLLKYIENKNENTIKKIKNSLTRIELDTFLYENQKLTTIFVKLWCIALKNIELKCRIIEELEDMYDTCSSGHVSRLINILSGFEVDGKHFNLSISWEEQIKANFTGRFQARLKHCKYFPNKCSVENCNYIIFSGYKTTETISGISYEVIKKTDVCSKHSSIPIVINELDIEDVKGEILNELIVSGNIFQKKYLKYFYLANLMSIHDELQSEFVPNYLSFEEFEEIFRKVVMEFEEGK